MTHSILQGDCIERMAEMEEASVDAIVTDPPYGLSAEPDIAEVLTHWLAGDDYKHHGGGFMGNSWDSFVPGPAYWSAAYRVLKPGGHLLAFAGSRTVDLMGIAIRMGGFEIRDSIMWLYGSGFPKSLDISKAIDKANGRNFEDRYALGRHLRERREAAGLTRAEVNAWFGYKDGCEHWERQDPSGARVPTIADWHVLAERLGLSDEFLPLVEREEAEREVTGRAEGAASKNTASLGDFEPEYDATVPALPEAAQWEGWGTALKPAHEPIVVARKPPIGNVAENFLEYGTGGINVGACRLDSVSDGPGTTPVAEKGSGRTLEGGEIERQPYDGATGRWPANIALSHTEDCGEECAPGSPIAELDRQSGRLQSGLIRAGSRREGLGYHGALGNTVSNDSYGDSGGASRFFYQAKTSRAERNAGLEAMPRAAEKPTAMSGAKNTRECNVCSSRGKPHGPLGDQPWPTCGHDDWSWVAEGHSHKGEQRNNHPTVKPINLMRHLIRLVTPPGGVVLDPFGGSGTTKCAADLEGVDCILVEREPEYVAIAEARSAFWSQHVGREVGDVLGLHSVSEKQKKAHADLGQGTLDLEAAA